MIMKDVDMEDAHGTGTCVQIHCLKSVSYYAFVSYAQWISCRISLGLWWRWCERGESWTETVSEFKDRTLNLGERF